MFIGITQRLIINKSYYEERETLALDWGKLFANEKLFEGFLPLPLSYELDFKHYIAHLKAVILSGGNDLYSYNSNDLSKKRDEYEKHIIAFCLKNKLPLLGICRGAQIIASFFNSTLKQCKNHLNEHQIFTNEGLQFRTNSFHNYHISSLGKDLSVLASANDGSCEAFKHKICPIYGLMWHIERDKGLENTHILKEWLDTIKR
ncbi:gamma-glutamyl-gamma-aminobutyrate hydrolase family protein [Campylobacter sp. MIT 21-1685]|uniref:gamma-glutamyl-CDP-amidate hydrolase n=1 Tax=unclassified Campylobacter TaxID=2593542 RepID=UPI00224B803F|nr:MULTISPECIES: gamma-glutamyl-CDP-amidate hydrolase [unclassified Campylobacter]MCX2682335.1 gamma-glutamyl-gamma-aminobutyrate hydrolase family protein [Campylobacter sp. MIT 21-1684]MCX2750615.1 gamma-glutamyl-gamma-aminobutyrate hydrolase family protein [Campylobacter sp. MIT 21-1682]MCX2806837.1 gamma-glutamyl-gamma-aminobutyrate hydrolase family protein [Campylobacter sp. MIT 21-1685]